MSEVEQQVVDPRAKFVNILTDEFNLSLSDIKAENLHVMWGSDIREDFIVALGYAVIQSRPPEAPGSYTEVTPELIDGKYYQTWQLTEDTPVDPADALNDAKTAAKNAVSDYVQQSMERGVPFDFPADGDFVTHHIQIRDVDRVNILGMSVKAERDAELIQYFRTRENIMVAVSSDVVRRMSDASYDGYVKIKGAEWSLNDATQAASTIEDIPAVPADLQTFYSGFAGVRWVE